MKILSERQLRKMVYGALAPILRRESIIDSMDSGFIDALTFVQQKMAAEFEAKADGAPLVPN